MRRRVLDLLFVAYLAVVGYGVFGPAPGEGLDRAGDRLRSVEREVREAVPGRPAGAEPAADDPWFEGWTAEEVGNVAMFVPLGALFPLRFRRWAWWTVPVGVAVSGAIELTQRLFLDWRSPTLRDIWFNGVGTVIGFALWLAWRTVVRQPPAA